MHELKLLPFALYLSFCFAPPSNLEPHPIDPFIENLLMAESSGSHTRGGEVVKSHKGAIGKWQVMPVALGFYNMKTGRNWKVKDLENETTNGIVGYWTLKKYYELSGSNIVLAVNFYNQGHNSDRKKIYYSYVNRICGAVYRDFMKTNQIKWMNGTYAWLK